MNIEPFKRLPQAQIEKNMACYNILKHIEGYASNYNSNTLLSLHALSDKLKAHQGDEHQAELRYHKMRNKAVLAEWDFHNAILALKDEVKNQFGCESAEMRALSSKPVIEIINQQ